MNPEHLLTIGGTIVTALVGALAVVWRLWLAQSRREVERLDAELKEARARIVDLETKRLEIATRRGNDAVRALGQVTEALLAIDKTLRGRDG